MRRIWSYTTDFVHKINRILSWLPILWKDRDWDYAFLLTIMQFKMRRMADCIEENNIVEGAGRTAKQLRYAARLVDLYFDAEQLTTIKERNKEFQEKWGKPDFDFEGTRFKIVYPKATEEEYAQADLDFTEVVYKNAAEEEQCLDRLLKHLNKYMRGWWD